MIAFQCSCGYGLQVHDSMAGHQVRCPYCHSVVTVRPPAPAGYVPFAPPAAPPGGFAAPGYPGVQSGYRESTALKALYIGLLAFGVLLAIFIYFVAFDELSEGELVMLTAVWFFPIVMGAYGLASQRLVRHLVEGRASSIAEAARMSARLTGPLALIWMFPFLFLKFRSPFLVTVVAAVFWALLLVFFFMVIFPLL